MMRELAMPRNEDTTDGNKGDVLSFETAREEQIEKRRRSYERVIFKNVLGVYTVMEQKGLHAIELVDISEMGLSFQVPRNSDLELAEGTVLNMRLYFSPDSYLPLRVKVVRTVDAIEEGASVRQYGCLIDKTLKSYRAIYHFVRFIVNCAEHGHEDREHLKIFY